MHFSFSTNDNYTFVERLFLEYTSLHDNSGGNDLKHEVCLNCCISISPTLQYADTINKHKVSLREKILFTLFENIEEMKMLSDIRRWKK